MFDDVLLLGKGGRTVYLGPANAALSYFERLGFRCPPLVNAADFMMDVISGEVPREGHPEFRASDLFDIWNQQRAPLDIIRPAVTNSSVISVNDVPSAQDDTEVLPLVRDSYLVYVSSCVA